jgi:5-methylcytosine-specific restriction endonuclease McrA
MVSQNVREIVLARDNFCCQVCGHKGSKSNPLTMHHVRFRCHGGNSKPENLVTWCRKCHASYHKEFAITHKKPKKPKKRRKNGRR